MKPIKKPSSTSRENISKPKDENRKTTVKLSVVSSAERDMYRVSSYGYLIP